MNQLAATLSIFLTGIALFAAADESTPAPPADSPTADLVEAAQGAKARRRNSSTKVITNADVKKAKGKLIVKAGSQPALAETPVKPMLQAHQERLAAIRATEARMKAAEERMAAIAKEMVALELSYYEENDLDRRDTEIASRFLEAKERMKAATAERDEAKLALEPPAVAGEDPSAPPVNDR